MDNNRESPATVSAAAAALLARLQPGRQDPVLFAQLARLAVLSTVEVAMLRRDVDGVRVLLARRAPDDLWWPGLWHVPGTVLLASDEAGERFEAQVRRLLCLECEDSVRALSAPVCYDARPRDGVRGKELTAFCWLLAEPAAAGELPEYLRFASFAEVQALDAAGQLVEGHVRTVAEALSAHRAASGEQDRYAAQTAARCPEDRWRARADALTAQHATVSKLTVGYRIRLHGGIGIPEKTGFWRPTRRAAERFKRSVERA